MKAARILVLAVALTAGGAAAFLIGSDEEKKPEAPPPPVVQLDATSSQDLRPQAWNIVRFGVGNKS
jgi:hypothetical protein